MVTESKGKLTIVSRCLKHFNALLDCRSRIPFTARGIDRRRQIDVHAKVHIGEPASLLDRLVKGTWVWLGQCSEDPGTSRV